MWNMWPLYRNVSTFAVGVFILVWQTAFENAAQPILVGAGLALLGVTATDLAGRIRNGGR